MLGELYDSGITQEEVEETIKGDEIMESLRFGLVCGGVFKRWQSDCC